MLDTGSMLKGLALRRSWRMLIRRTLPWIPAALLVLIVIVPVGLFVWLLFYIDVFTIQAVTVVDAREHTLLATREVIERRLEQMPLGRNIFFVQTKVLESDIMGAVPQVRSVHVVRKLPGTIKAIVQEKTPVMLLLSNQQYYFVDADGVAYEEARLDTLPGVVLPTVKNNDVTATVTLGAAVVTPLFVSFLQKVQNELPEKINSEVAEIRIPSLSAREMHVVLNTNWQIRFDVMRSAERQFDILQQIIAAMSDEEKASLEYIDLRVPNRVYYRSTRS